MKKLKIGVLGAGGRMGQEIARILNDEKKVQAFLGIDPAGASFGFLHASKNFKTELVKEVDLWIDFSSPAALSELLALAVKNKTPIVSGTTGIGSKQKNALKAASKKIPVLWASNMSLGVAVLNRAIQTYANLEGFDFQIEEIHHNRKKDKPSGTALTLQESLVKAVGRSVPAPLAIRGGGVYGVHKVWAMSDEEVLMFEHQALNRAVFARGAVRAGLWLSRKKPGLYEIGDLLL